MKTGIIALGLLASMGAAAQDYSQYTPGSSEGIVYFLPKTVIEVKVIVTKVSYTPGEFCQYANRYLRLNNVTSQPNEYWEIKKIITQPAGIPDTNNAYTIKLKDKSLASNIELTKEGIIKAVNTTAPKDEETNDLQLEKPQKQTNPRKFMTEEILLAGSTAKMAELTAKEIYNIRESKNTILRGQADNMPKDGASLKLIMDNLDKQEQALTQMFKGITSREDKVFTFRIEPEEINNQTVCRFSQKLGVLGADNLAGEPIYISIKNTGMLPANPEPDNKKKKLDGIIYNIPGKAEVNVTFREKKMFKGEVSVSGFGNKEVLVDDLFNKKVNTRVIFNTTTGGILKIDKDL